MYHPQILLNFYIPKSG